MKMMNGVLEAKCGSNVLTRNSVRVSYALNLFLCLLSRNRYGKANNNNITK